MGKSEALIVGAGIVGSACLLYQKEKDAEVTVFDRGVDKPPRQQQGLSAPDFPVVIKLGIECPFVFIFTKI